MKSKQPIVTGYYRVGSQKQIKLSVKDKLKLIEKEIAMEEERMKELTIAFRASSEKYNKLRSKQRSLMVELYKEASREDKLSELLRIGMLKEDEYIALGGTIE